MNKYERWEKIGEEYFKNVTPEQLFKDSLEVGIRLVPKGHPNLRRRIRTYRVKASSRKKFKEFFQQY